VEESPAPAPGPLGAVAPDVCYSCHDQMRNLERVVHPHQIGVPFDFDCTACHDPPPRGWPRDVKGHPTQFNCTTCHVAHGSVKRESRTQPCMTCHDGHTMQEWHGSPHAVGEVGCTDCHDPHPAAGPPMAVDEPGVSYRCHSQMQQLEQVAHSHQVLGPNGFVCSTCHRPHGRVMAHTRTDVCLHCHQGAPAMAWHSSSHGRHGVACADCHSAHPEIAVPRVIPVGHTNVRRPRRLPMAVEEPEVCYECHPQIYGKTSMPSHHPIQEGKLVCSDCHDGHGQGLGNLTTDSLNELCYQCHAEKEGPFVWEHSPVTENCDYCHEPHGTVANNLLRQPTTFLCLRCHAGHSLHSNLDEDTCTRCHFVDGDFTNVGGGPPIPPVPTTATLRRALFTDCTQCHTQIHGSDLPSGWECGGMMRR